MSIFKNYVTTQIADFLNAIGIPTRPGVVTEKSFLPGIAVTPQGLQIDEATLLYPGDLLHEAGHLAVAAPATRFTLHNHLGDDPAEEMMAIAWSYAAVVHLGIDPTIVFHPQGYKGAAASILDNFQAGRYFGVPMLQYHGMCADTQRAAATGVPAYPCMHHWLRQLDGQP
jgi:hypothetical protein